MKQIILGVAVLGIIFLSDVKERSQRPLYWTPPLIHFDLGYPDFLANLLWLRFLQSADFCSFEEGHPVYTGKLRHCEKGWSYRITSAIINLAPRFREPYLYSAVLLSVFTGDIKGAEQILLKGVKQFPKDWRLAFHSAYFYSTELPNPEKAQYYAFKSAQNGGPAWLYEFSHTMQKKHTKLFDKAILGNMKNLTQEQKQYIRKKRSNK